MRPLFQNNHLFKTWRPEKSGQNFVDSILKQNFLERFLFLHNVLKKCFTSNALAQDYEISIADALEIPQSCMKPLINKYVCTESTDT